MSEIEVVPKWVIYGLVDPRICAELEKVRYVGKTKENPPEKRFKAHLSDSITHDTHFGKWLRKMNAEETLPIFVILEKGFNDEWEECERKWIKFFPNLTNSTAGGEGFSDNGENSKIVKLKISKAVTELWKNKIYGDFSQKLRDAWARPEVRQRYVNGSRNRWNDESRGEREKYSKTQTQITDSMDWRKNHSQKLIDKWQDPVYREKILTPERSQNLSTKLTEHWADESVREEASLRTKILHTNLEFREHWLASKQTQEARSVASTNAKKSWEDPKLKEDASLRMWAQWKDPVFRENCVKQTSIRSTEMWIKIRASGCKNPKQYKEVKEAGCETLQEYEEFMETFKK
jgi:hypothetical protein